MKFKAKPVFVEANQFDGTFKCMEQLEALFPEIKTVSASYNEERNTVSYWKIDTQTKGMEVHKTDWIVRTEKGSVVAVREETLMSLYEPV